MTIYFVLFDGCEILDVTGPVQALFEANNYGTSYDLIYCASTPSILTAQGMTIADLQPLPDVSEDDWIFVPGYSQHTVTPPYDVVRWLQDISPTGCRICSVCTGTFIIGAAGLLHNKHCTTHWKHINRLQERFPTSKVLNNRLYVSDGNIVSSAGIVSGIDLTLSLIEKDAGAHVAANVAREMVVYTRRDGSQSQSSVYLDYQNHLHSGIHSVQQHLIQNPAAPVNLPELADIAHMSPRHLTRVFRRETGISIGEYRTKLRLELARTLIEQSSLTLEVIAARCGFADARQLRRIWKKKHHFAPSELRKM